MPIAQGVAPCRHTAGRRRHLSWKDKRAIPPLRALSEPPKGETESKAELFLREELEREGVSVAEAIAPDTPEEIVAATRLLLEDMVARNGLETDQMVSLIFTATGDVTSQFPAVAAREMGLLAVPLLCATEIPVPGSLSRCVRVMLHAYMPAGLEATHCYLREAVQLRDDLAEGATGGDSEA